MMEDKDINRALVVLIGHGFNPWPNHDKSRVIAEFGELKGNQLLQQIDDIYYSVGEITPDWDKMTLVEASEFAASKYALKYPFLDQEALAAIAWDYAFGWK